MTTPPTPLRGYLRPITLRLRSEHGSTLVEALVAAVLLIGGLLATFMALDTANAKGTRTKAREGATNLARELLEATRDTSFAGVGATTTWFQPKLQALSGGSGTVTTPNSYTQQTTATRRGTTYTIQTSWCSVDDSKDGYGAHSGAVHWCPDSASTGTSDGAPEDLKRVTQTIDYALGGTAQPTLVQTATVGPSGVSIGPQLTLALTAPTGLSQTAPVVTTGNSVTYVATAQGAFDVKFSVDGVEKAAGVTNNGNGTWTFVWDITGLKDATYTIAAVALDALGTRGSPASIATKIAKGAPVTPTGVSGGYNYVNPPKTGPPTSATVVELDWDANPEGSVTGYEVLRGATSVCGSQTSTATDCIDPGAPTSAGTVTTYTVKTWYRDANNAMASVQSTINVTAPGTGGSVPTTYYLNTSTTYAGTSCVTATSKKDALPTMGTADTVFQSTMIAGCLPPFSSSVSMAAGTATASIWFSNAGSKSCNPTGGLLLNNASAIGTLWAMPTIPGNSATVTRYQATTTVSAQTFAAGDQISFYQNVRPNTQCTLNLSYNSATHPSSITLPTLTSSGTALTTPNQPAGLTVTANGDGTRTLNWTAPTSGTAVDFYRIYRDGASGCASPTNYTCRIDSTDVNSTTVATASAVNATTLALADATGFAAGQKVSIDTGTNLDTMTISSVSGNTLTLSAAMPHAHAVGAAVKSASWTDTATGGSAHTYRVTAVSSALAESDFATPGAVTG